MILPGAETVGTAASYDAMKWRISDVPMRANEHMPHDIVGMLADRCIADILTFSTLQACSMRCGLR